MTIIRTSCVECGTVNLAPSDVTLTDYGHEWRYEFECPACDTPISYEAPDRIRYILLGVGVAETEAQPLPAPIRRLLQGLRDRAVEAEFRDELEMVESLADLGWT